LQWGGVTSNGGRMDLGWDDGTSGAYVKLGIPVLQPGTNVASNTAEKRWRRFLYAPVPGREHHADGGREHHADAHDKEPVVLHLWQGGYFSPQQYVILNLPVEYMGRNGLFTYDLKGSIGVQHYRQDASKLFPNHRHIQPGSSGPPEAFIPAAAKQASLIRSARRGEYQLAPQTYGRRDSVSWHAYQYLELLAAGTLRYSFTKQGGAVSFPRRRLTSPYLSLTN